MRDIEALGPRAFQQRLTPLAPRKTKKCRRFVLGFDTEYDSETAEPVCLQLSFEGAEFFQPIINRFTLARLAESAPALIDPEPGDEVYLATYWSPAELSMIAPGWWEEGKLVPVNGAGVLNVEWDHGGVKFCIYDVFHWFDPAPLKKVAEAFGMKKLEWDRANVSRADLKKKGFREYAMNDAHLCERILLGLQDEMLSRGIDVLRSRTPASASMRCYRENWLKVDVTQRDESLRRVAMRANLGGIGEAYWHADLEGDFVQIDADSLYPTAVDALQSLPAHTSDWRSLKLGETLPEWSEGICKVRFTFPEGEQYPCLPVVVKGVGMVYPLSGISYCTISEARVAESFGARVKYFQAWYYDPRACDTSFRDYICTLLAEKRALDKKGASAKRYASKFLLNAGIGKYSQRRGADWEDLKRIAKEDAVPLAVVASAQYKHPEKTRRSEPGDSWMPEWHALILGKARALMFPRMRAARSIMTTTDSILCERRAADAALALPGMSWKVEAETKKLRAIRQRLYQGDGMKTAAHAVHARKEEAEKLIRETPLDSKTKYRVKKRVTLLDAVSGKGLFGAPKYREMTYDSHASLKREYLKDGTSRPWLTIDSIPQSVNA